MKIVAAAAVAAALLATPSANAQESRMSETLKAVAPALDRYREQTLLGGVWKRTDLSARDRGIVTLAALIARNEPGEMAFTMNRALDDGVAPREVSEIITHLAFYAGWPNATSAVAVAKDVFAARKIGPDQLPSASPDPLPLDEKAEATRAETVGRQFGAIAPGLVRNTTDVLFRDLWLRPDLAPRDRSLVTVVALIATGQTAQIPYHLGRAMDNGLKPPEVGGVLTHLAFYVGWPSVFSALPVVKDVIEKRSR
ncbi:carboxymuconolactone decarboxylase family protein [Rhodoplanes sp. SY1]|uniref:carboxymuconolactone decarboxylase family protein n=1 Tax=Rhodoplanes sp. SY1 TaxID=3166646 RepID=UPI0038B6697F